MANGDAAVADGMEVLTGNEDRRMGYDEVNKTRDYIATKIAAAISGVKTWATGLFLAKSEAAPPGTVAASKLVRYDGNTRIATSYPTSDAHAANKVYVDNAIAAIPASGVPASGGTFTGNVYFPNATAASSSYTVAYLNGDGRLSKGASSRRYKEHITDAPHLGDIFPALREFEMTGGDGHRKIGHIAEELAEHADQARFVVWADLGTGPVADSIDFIALLLAQTAQLNTRVSDLAQRLDALEGR